MWIVKMSKLQTILSFLRLNDVKLISAFIDAGKICDEDLCVCIEKLVENHEDKILQLIGEYSTEKMMNHLHGFLYYYADDTEPQSCGDLYEGFDDYYQHVNEMSSEEYALFVAQLQCKSLD